jgi:hypothetical protein
MNILVVNDLHSGSNYGPVTEDKIRNPYQKWVYAKITDVAKYCQSITLDYLVGDGDMVDGYASKDSTSQWTTDVNDQVNCAIELLEKFKTPKTKVIGVGGSGYHRGKGSGFDGDRMVIEGLGGKFNKNTYYLNTPYGVIQFLHVGKNIKNEVNTIQINNGEIENHKVKLLVAGHLHRYEAYEKGSVKVVHCPCWQYPTDFMQGFGVSPTVDIGCLLIRVDEFGIDIRPLRFPIPFEITQEMSGWEDITEKQIRKRNEIDLKKLSELSGISPQILQVVRNIDGQRFGELQLPATPEVKVEKIKINKMVIPKI